MKKLLIFALALMLLLPLLVGCDTAENDLPPINDETENDTSGNDGNDGNDVPPANDGGDEVLMGEGEDDLPTGTIRGNLTFNGLSIEMLLTAPFASVLDILGAPIHHGGSKFTFDNGLEPDAGHARYPLSHLSIFSQGLPGQSENLHLLELNGVSMNMSRTEIIEELGEPESYNEYFIRYIIVGEDFEFSMLVSFNNVYPLNDSETVYGIRFDPLNNDHFVPDESINVDNWWNDGDGWTWND